MSEPEKVKHIFGAGIPTSNGIVQEVVDVLRKALDRAEAGELRGVAVIMVDVAGNVDNDRAFTPHRHQLIAGCEFLKQNLMV